MTKKNSGHDAYIKAAAPFAKPILSHLREIVHRACPEVEETIKWGVPHFDYKGILCSMAAFNKHCAFSFWKASIMSDPEKVLTIAGRTAMGHFERITSLSDLPSDKILISYLKEAKKLNDEDVKLPRQKTDVDKRFTVPPYFLKAVKSNKTAWRKFESFSYSHQKEYVEWIEEAKTEATREKRLTTAIEWMTEGKSRNWKYVKK